ncbi:hypothetical protein COH21_002285 [Aspergillus flavus]|nr:hypothetical protein COH21_002285 [Aspergillus flavus]
MEVVLYQRDFKRLTELETKFGKEQKLTEEAEVRLYDRYITVRTSILIQMRNVAWAYKFAVLDNEPTQIDPLKNVQDYRKDLFDLVMKLQRFKGQIWHEDNTIPEFGGHANKSDFAFKISTTGVYNDIRKLDIFTFVGHVFSREYSYNIVEGKPVMDTAFTINTNEYSAPPPFTTWTVEITNPGSLDLSGLTSMNLQWHGEKYNEEFLG